MKQVLKAAPEYLLAYVLGFITLILSDITVTSLFIGAILVGFIAGPLAGGATFFLGYVGLRFVNAISTAIARVASTINQRDTHL